MGSAANLSQTSRENRFDSPQVSKTCMTTVYLCMADTLATFSIPRIPVHDALSSNIFSSIFSPPMTTNLCCVLTCHHHRSNRFKLSKNQRMYKNIQRIYFIQNTHAKEQRDT